MKADVQLITIIKELIATPESEMDTGTALMLLQLADRFDIGAIWLFRGAGDGGYECRHATVPLAHLALIPPAALPHDWVTGTNCRALWLAGPDDPAAGPGLAACLAAHGRDGLCLFPVESEARLMGFMVAALPAGRFDPAGDTGRALADLAEIMLHKLSQRDEAQRKAEATATLAAVLEALPDMLFELDVEGRYTGFFAGPLHLIAMEPDAFKGKYAADELPPEIAQVIQQAVEQVAEHGHVENLTYVMNLYDKRHYFEISGSRRQPATPDEQPTSIFLVRDVTHSQEMAVELRRFESITQAMSNLVTIMDTELRVTWVNPAFERHTGWTLDEIKGQFIRDMVRCPESDPEVAAGIDEAMAELRPYIGQIINKDRFGNRYYVDFNIIPLFGPEGGVEGFVAVETVVTRLKQQQLVLAEMAESAAAAKSRLSNALSALPDSVMIFDSDERLVTANPACHQSFPEMADRLFPGATLSDICAAILRLGLSGVQFSESETALADLLELYRRPRYADEHELQDGRWFRIVNNHTADGGLIMVVIDVTARRKQLAALDAVNQEMTYALNELDLAKRRLASIMEATRVGTWELEFPEGVLTLSKQWGHIIGVNSTGRLVMAHSEFIDMVHPEDRALMEATEPVHTAGSSDMFEHEFRLRHIDGDWIWILSRGRVVKRNDLGEPLQVVGVDLDISDQKRLEVEARESEAYLHSAMESSVSAIAIYDPEDLLVYCNSEAECILGLKLGEPCGRDPDGPQWVMETVDGVPLPQEYGPCSLARRAGGIVRDIRFAVRWPDGRRQVMTCNATPVGGRNGNTVISFWDITDQLEATERLTQALAHSEEINRAKSIFLANMSHEIRTPLNGVLGMAEVLSLQVTNPEHSRMIQMIRQSGETLLAVLNSILDMSKIEAGKMEIEQIPFSLQELLQQVDTVYSILAEEKGLDFDLEISSGCNILRIGDPHRIHQILHNLLSNAIKFSNMGTITLTVICRPGQPVIFEIHDQGVGMTEEQSERVFRSFEQADGSMTRRFGGTGLGLSIVRELVLLMGGELTMTSQPNIGTKILVCLPLQAA